MDAHLIAEFNQLHDLRFSDLRLLQQAFVHSSYLNEQDPADVALNDNERLEFLGDSVLGFVVADILFRRFPSATEGYLTHLRTHLVRRESFAELATELDMGRYLLLGVGEEESGGRLRTANLCDAFEALAGAIYLDQGLDGVHRTIAPRIISKLDKVSYQLLLKDPKSRFQEWAQRVLNVTPRYRAVDSFGPDHAKIFVSKVAVHGAYYGVGRGSSKQDAEQAAAVMALYRVGEPAPEYQPDSELEGRYGLGVNTDGEMQDQLATHQQ
jgi:ribonuclease-3